MFWAKWLLLGLLVLPAAEIAVFIMVATKIGFLTTLAVTLAMSALGVAMIRSAGRARLTRFRHAVAGGMAGRAELAPEDFLTVGVGFLWVIPGFLTDALGALLLVPMVRRRLGSVFRSAGTRSGRRADVLELRPDEWHQVPDERIGSDRPSDRSS